MHEECLHASHSRVIVGQGRVGEEGGGEGEEVRERGAIR